MALEHCPTCSVGHLHPVRLTYAHLYGDTLVHFPNVPSERCDVCGQVYYDQLVLRRLELLVGEAGPPPNRTDVSPASQSTEPPPIAALHPRAD